MSNQNHTNVSKKDIELMNRNYSGISGFAENIRTQISILDAGEFVMYSH